MDSPRTGMEPPRTLAAQPAAAVLGPDAAPLVEGVAAPGLGSLPAPRSAGLSRTRLEQMLLMARQMQQH